MKTKRDKNVKYSLFSIRTGIGIFISTAAAVFYTTITLARAQSRIDDTATEYDAWWVAISTFVFLCVVDTLVILIYRKLTVKNPLLRILDATEKIGAGDFSVRLPIKHEKHFLNEYDVMSQNINKMAEELASIETLRRDFVANVSHEFKAPLALMKNSCSIIVQPDLSEEDRIKYIKNISAATTRMDGLITNVLNLNKIESQKIVTKSKKINITELLRESILLFEPMWDDKNIDIEVIADDSIEINSDRELLMIMFQNLLSNAFKFTPDNGKVTVTVTEHNNTVEVAITDSGEGIPEEKLERIFEKFYQTDTSHATQGNGLGLALVKSIVLILGYSICVESKQDKGSTFIVNMKK